MNPFQNKLLAEPLATHSVNGWRFPFARSRARAVFVAAGMGVSLSAQAMDVNTATTSELQSMKGVGPRTAQIIINERERAGKFESLQDLSDRVKGLGGRRLKALQAAGLRVGTSGTQALKQDLAAVNLTTKAVGRQSAGMPTHAQATPLVELMP